MIRSYAFIALLPALVILAGILVSLPVLLVLQALARL